MEMIPFTHTWPYEMMMGDVYFDSCPYCHQEQVRTNMKKIDFKRAQEGIKTRLIMPCCHEVMTIIEVDDDYFWTDKPLRKG